MKSIVKLVSSIMRRTRFITDEEHYYSQAVDLADLERRMKMVQRGMAPYQQFVRH